ncbi:hypothetical protein [Planctobacterium marinum]|uniref:hypothetical protein n=1 Tax=Planctobacterium marinum TaxID=1631968 RepID=UPI001E557AC0|nr:hypothetical protein [Planctobacterium marinum]MCC2604073.1 hypothetical protein [Planctobacterium marinum]
MDVENIPLTELRQQIAMLFNQQEYQQVIDLFDHIRSSSHTLSNIQRNIYPIWALKVIALSMLNGDDTAELKVLEAHCSSRVELMSPNCQLLLSMRYFNYIEAMETQSREVLAAKLKMYELQGEAAKWQTAYEVFEQLPPNEIEKQISITINESNEVYPLEQIKSFHINNELPNENVFIEFCVENEHRTVRAVIPGPNNDGICDEGYVAFEGNQAAKFPITRFQVTESMALSPSGLSIRTESLCINIMNAKFLNSQVARC